MSEVILLDTHILLWWIDRNFDAFPASWRDRIESATQVGISPISCYEIALAHQKGRIQLAYPVRDWLQNALHLGGIDLFPLTDTVATRAVELTPIHKDPFDRLIIATALEYRAKIASIDRFFLQYPEIKHCLLRP
jgi:PIN domain nuclease of toxin-antitoxin system